MRPGRRRHGTRTALALIAVIALLASVVFGGRRYFYCPLMAEVSFHACCAHADDDGVAVDDEGCCTARELDRADPGVFTASAHVIAAPLVAVLPAPAATHAPDLSPVRPFAHEARAGPPGADARENRLRLMVFLT
jgi:hypothetical protein